MSNPISNHITWYKLPLTPYRLQSYKSPTNAKTKSLDHIAWFKRQIEKNAKSRKTPTNAITPTPYFKSGLARLTLHNRDMSNSISNHITWYKLPLTPYRIQSYKSPTKAKMKSLDHIAWIKRHIEKNAYQRYYASAVFQIRISPTYSAQQRTSCCWLGEIMWTQNSTEQAILERESKEPICILESVKKNFVSFKIILYFIFIHSFIHSFTPVKNLMSLYFALVKR